VATAGDVDADGVQDLIIGAPEKRRYPDGGHAVVYSGRDDQELMRLKTTEMGTSLLGFAVGPVGDLDHDGRADVAVGAPGDPFWDSRHGGERWGTYGGKTVGEWTGGGGLFIYSGRTGGLL